MTTSDNGMGKGGGSALIVGASRGLGLGLAEAYLARGWTVVATVRGEAQTGLHALAERAGQRLAGGRLAIEQLDITDAGQLAAIRQRLAGRSFDLLFVNAGIATDPHVPIANVSDADFTRLMLTNALGPMRVVEALGPLVPEGGTIGVMSSRLGSVAENVAGGWEAYRASKAALNTLMRSYAARHAGDPRSLLLMNPGWVRTDLGGPGARLEIADSVAGLVETMTAQAGQPGLRFLDYRGAAIAW